MTVYWPQYYTQGICIWCDHVMYWFCLLWLSVCLSVTLTHRSVKDQFEHIKLGTCHLIGQWYPGNNYSSMFAKFIEQTNYHNMFNVTIFSGQSADAIWLDNGFLAITFYWIFRKLTQQTHFHKLSLEILFWLNVQLSSDWLMDSHPKLGNHHILWNL